MANILVTGAAGFIGAHVSARFLDRNDQVMGVDNLNDYYDVALKQDRLATLTGRPGFEFRRMDIGDRTGLADLFAECSFDRVVHLAAQAGARYSRDNPALFVDSNFVGFANILEGCRQTEVSHLVYASSSSVYGASEQHPYAVVNSADHPVSIYGATKRANELMAHAYSHLFQLPTTGLRFFTVYGPWGRPDMAPHLFTRAILAGEPVRLFSHGQMQRDFTYIDDIVEAVLRVTDSTASPDPDWRAEQPVPGRSSAPFRVLNIGNCRPVELEAFVDTLEACLGRKAKREYLPPQAGDLTATYADIDHLQLLTGFTPSTTLAEGLEKFVAWYRAYHGAT